MACTQGVRPCPSPPPRHSLRILGYLRLGPCPPRPPPWLNETSPSGCRDPRAPSAPRALDPSHATPCPWTVPCCREPIRLRRYLVFTQGTPMRARAPTQARLKFTGRSGCGALPVRRTAGAFQQGQQMARTWAVPRYRKSVLLRYHRGPLATVALAHGTKEPTGGTMSVATPTSDRFGPNPPGRPMICLDGGRSHSA